MIKIVTDTTCDLPADWLSRYNITVVPINIQFGSETFHEGRSIDADKFYRRIRETGILPTTSQPSIGEFCELYETLAADGSQVLSIHVTSKLSGTWQSATMAARRLEGRHQVRVIDSLNGSTGLGLMVREAAQLAETGLPLEEIASRLEARRPAVKVFIMLHDLRFARMSGRVGRLQELLASLLDIKPIVGVDEGSLILLERVRSQKNGLARMQALAEAEVGRAPVHLGMVHALAETPAQNLLEEVKARLNCRDTYITDLSLSLAVHFGPGTVGFALYPADEGSYYG